LRKTSAWGGLKRRKFDGVLGEGEAGRGGKPHLSLRAGLLAKNARKWGTRQ